MDDIWIISWFSHTAFDANPIWKSPSISIRNLKNTVFPSKNVVWRLKTTISYKNVSLKKRVYFSVPFPLFKGPGRAHMGP